MKTSFELGFEKRASSVLSKSYQGAKNAILAESANAGKAALNAGKQLANKADKSVDLGTYWGAKTAPVRKFWS